VEPKNPLKLPVILTTKQDVIHVHRELQHFYDSVVQATIRHESPVKYPAISDSLRALAVDNKINLHDERSCKNLLNDLEKLRDSLIILHISFPNDPPTDILQKIVTWLRKEISPNVVIQVGLQPSIAAGIVLRTSNHQYDFSLRQHLYKNRDKLVEVFKA
jgi:F0F1-type ATP synthase delta subunit